MPVQMAKEISRASVGVCLQRGEHLPFVLEKEIDARVLEDKGADTESAEQETDISWFSTKEENLQGVETEDEKERCEKMFGVLSQVSWMETSFFRLNILQPEKT